MENKSGIRPVKFQVLVKPKEIEDRTAGGIIIPEKARERREREQAEGTLVAFAPAAFTDPDWIDYPKVGDTVFYDKYGGCIVTGRDGVRYRLLNDGELGAVIYG